MILDAPCNEDLAEDLFYQFQMLLAALKNSDKQAFNPKGLCHAYKDISGKPVNVTEQMDADEFLSHFLDKIEKSLEVLIPPSLNCSYLDFFSSFFSLFN